MGNRRPASPPPLLRRVTGAAITLAAVISGGCSEKKPGPSPAETAAPAAPGSVAAVLGLDGGVLDNVDPPPPAGDLKADLDRFVNVESCVKERANVDPLLGDAIRAIGYDTLLRDACRLLEATKDKKPESCEKIDSSALRTRCKSWVAMVAQTPDTCPLQFEGVPTRGRTPTCVAVAGRDPRLCAGEARTAPRATCEALVSRDAAKCDVLFPADQPSCKRELTRWRALLGSPLDGLAKLPASRGKLSVKPAAGNASDAGTGGAAHEADLATELGHGAVVITARERARVELGMIGESETTRMAPSPNRRPRLGIALLLEPGNGKDPPKPLLERLELEIPGEATLVHPGSRCDCTIKSAHVDRTRGGEVTIALTGTIGSGGRSYAIDVDLGTFVRDVVAEASGTPRVLPPVHPTIGLGALGSTPSNATDAGR